MNVMEAMDVFPTLHVDVLVSHHQSLQIEPKTNPLKSSVNGYHWLKEISTKPQSLRIDNKHTNQLRSGIVTLILYK